MKFTVAKLLLNKSLQAVSRIVENKSPIPVLNGVKLEVTETGLTVTGCDTEMMIQSFISTQTDDQDHMYIAATGEGVLHAQILNEYIRKIYADEIEIEIDSKFQGRIVADKTDLKINGYDPDEFPSLPQFTAEQSLVVDSEVLANFIRQTIFAVSTNEQAPILTGVNFSYVQGVLKCIATDRHRLAAVSYTLQGDAQFQQLVISSRALVELSRLLPEKSVDVHILFKDNQILFMFDEIKLYAKLLDGTYPDTDKIVQNSANYTTELVVSTEMLMSTMERAIILSRKEKGNVVKMYSLDDETIEIFASSSEHGKFKESISTRQPLNNAIRVSYNSKFMLDVLKVMDSEYVTIGFSGDMNPIFIKPTENHSDYQTVHLILPYRTAREDA